MILAAAQDRVEDNVPEGAGGGEAESAERDQPIYESSVFLLVHGF